MLRAAGVRNSPNWQNVAIRNWALRHGIDVGNEGHKGWAFFVESPSEGEALCKFVIEYRGPEWPPVRIVSRYLDRRHHPRDRRNEFCNMMELFCRLSRQQNPHAPDLEVRQSVVAPNWQASSTG